MFQALHRDGHESVHYFSAPEDQLQAIIAIHDTRRGPALGGCRMVAYRREADALADALRLARGMTFKAVLADVPQGGGKAVLLKPAQPFDRARLFAAFGRCVETLGGRYITAIDSGTSTADMAHVARETRHVTSVSSELDPSPWTALGVFRGIEAAVAVRLGRDDLRGLRCAVQGLGHVGHALARRLHAAGTSLVVADIDAAAVRRAEADFSAEVVDAGEIHRAECEVFVPCGLGGVLHDTSVAELRCAVVAGSANNQLATPDVAALLHARDVLYAPDYVINAGGLIFASLHHNGRPRHEIEEKTQRIGVTLRSLFERARQLRVSPQQIAEQRAAELLEGGRPAQAAFG